MHFLYIDEAGHSGKNLEDVQQPVFVMAGVVVSDEKWRRTDHAFQSTLKASFGHDPGPDFELHAEKLLAPDGEGPFAGWDRKKRNDLAHALLDLLDSRSHQVLLHWIHKGTLQAGEPPKKDFGVDWTDPWPLSFHLMLTMFEEFLRSSRTGSSSSGLVIADHSDVTLEYVRELSSQRRRSKGWRQLKKVVEIGYTATSHASHMVQLADLVAFTMKKWAEGQTEFGANWPAEAHEFFDGCREKVWKRTELKTLKCNKINAPAQYRDAMLAMRKA